MLTGNRSKGGRGIPEGTVHPRHDQPLECVERELRPVETTPGFLTTSTFPGISSGSSKVWSRVSVP